MVSPVAISSLGFKYFIIFAVISYCIPASVYYFFPETMGQSLEQINSVFQENKTPRSIVKATKLSASGAYRSSDADIDTEKDMGAVHVLNRKDSTSDENLYKV